MEDINVGDKLKKIREEKGFTLKQVSLSSGLSISFISQVERGLVDPSWSSLKRITAALDVKLRNLFDEPPQLFALVRNGQGFKNTTQHICREFLASIDDAAMEMIVTSFPPHSTSGIVTPHDGEEFVWVLEGNLNITLDDVTHTLSSGDSIYFRSSQPHTWENKTAEECKVLWIDTPPVHT